MFLKVNTSGAKPIKEQVIGQIKNLIDAGSLVPGTTLPASRMLAEKLGVSRFTIYQAYSELQAMGYLTSRPGSYNIVQKRRNETEYNPESKSIIDWNSVSNVNANAVYQKHKKFTYPDEISNDVINMHGLRPDERLFPIKEFKRSIDFVLKNIGPSTLSYASNKGYPPLREYIAQRLRLHGVAVSSEEILITSGAMNAIDLVLRLLAKPDKAVIVEAPTYSALLPLITMNNSKVISIPMKADGMDLNLLESILRKESVSFIYTIPNFHNPTGITTSHQHRERLLNICQKYRIPVLEDGFEEDLKYFGKVDLPIKSMDGNNVVIYTGTFSKALFPGLRLAWIAAEKECIERLTAIKRYSELSCGHLIQAAMNHFCREGFYDLHLKKLHRIYRKRMEVTIKSLETYLPNNVNWTKPVGGFTLWVKMPIKLKKLEFVETFEPFGVKVTPGMEFFFNENKSEYFRLSISLLNEKEIEEGIKRVGKALCVLEKKFTVPVNSHRKEVSKLKSDKGRR